MPNNEFVFLRHLKTKVDPNVPVSEWTLDEDGINQINNLLDDENLMHFDLIYSSKEKKAGLTAGYFATRSGKEVQQCKEFNELNRDKGKFSTSEDYRDNVKRSLLNLDKSYNRWEKASKALRRFENKVQELDVKYDDKRILIVSHGIVINLYFAKVKNQFHKIYDRWLANSFNSKENFAYYGIIMNNEIIKDII